MSQESIAAPVSVDQGGRPVVVVLGPGRSGTSLCGKILGQLGIRMEATLQRANEMNPEGYFEDARLADINKRLLAKLAPVSGAAPREDYPATLIADEVGELHAHIETSAFADENTWGFKHPRTSLLLPIYRRAFQRIGIVPRYVFCAREPGSVVESLHEADGTEWAIAERVYFLRSFLALRDCAANCYVMHYERLLEDPSTQIEKLWRYVSASDAPCPLTAPERKALVDPKLNRSELRATPVTNPLAARIGALLGTMEGSDFDRTPVMAELREIDGIHRTYQALLEQAGAAANKGSLDQIARLKAEVTQRERTADLLTAEVSTLQADCARLREDLGAALTRARSSENDSRDIRVLRKRLKLIQKERADLDAKLARTRADVEQERARRQEEHARSKDAQAELTRVSQSVRYRAGTLVIEALRRPGLRTLSLPWRLARLRARSKPRGQIR